MNKLLTLILLIVVTLAVLAGCSGDIILTSESDLTGIFEGVYIITENFGSNLAKQRSQPVIWTFTDTRYIMKIDIEKPFDPTFNVCRINGSYVLGAGVELTEISSQPDGEAGFDACDPDNNARGLFTLIKSNNADQITMKQFDVETNTVRELKLFKIS